MIYNDHKDNLVVYKPPLLAQPEARVGKKVFKSHFKTRHSLSLLFTKFIIFIKCLSDNVGMVIGADPDSSPGNVNGVERLIINESKCTKYSFIIHMIVC